MELDEEQRVTLRQFQEITNIQDREVAARTLASFNWNLERAIETHLLNEADGGDDTHSIRPDIEEIPPLLQHVSPIRPTRVLPIEIEQDNVNGTVDMDTDLDSIFNYEKNDITAPPLMLNLFGNPSEPNDKDQTYELKLDDIDGEYSVEKETKGAIRNYCEAHKGVLAAMIAQGKEKFTLFPNKFYPNNREFIRDNSEMCTEFFQNIVDEICKDLDESSRKTTTTTVNAYPEVMTYPRLLVPESLHLTAYLNKRRNSSTENSREGTLEKVPTTPKLFSFSDDALSSTIDPDKINLAKYCKDDAFMPCFSTKSLSDTAHEAFETPGKRKPLALYIHYDRGVNANIFASEIMCTNEISSFLRDHFILWGCDVTSTKEIIGKLTYWFKLLNISTNDQFFDATLNHRYPLLVLFVKEKGTIRISEVCDGRDTRDQVMRKLNGCVVSEMSDQEESQSTNEK